MKRAVFLQNIIKRTHKRAIIVAPTGIAAINAGGVTIHSQFQLPFGAFIPADMLPMSDKPAFNMNNRHTLKQQMRLQTKRRLACPCFARQKHRFLRLIDEFGCKY